MVKKGFGCFDSVALKGADSWERLLSDASKIKHNNKPYGRDKKMKRGGQLCLFVRRKKIQSGIIPNHESINGTVWSSTSNLSTGMHRPRQQHNDRLPAMNQTRRQPTVMLHTYFYQLSIVAVHQGFHSHTYIYITILT